MGKKGGKGKTAEKKERQQKKQDKAAKKRAGKVAKDAGEEDIESILAEIMKKDAAKIAVTIESSSQPTRRVNFSLSGLPSGSEFVLFGGEYFDGDQNDCYNDLYRWNLDDQTFQSISSPNTPPPRCSHQAAVYRDHLYIFGGEFATADQFHHYKDLWRLDLKTNAWSCLEAKGGPSPRSGHRMIVWRNYLVVFGGFYEAFRETKWFNDLYLFNLAQLKWKKIDFPVHKYVPSPRSGCQLALSPGSDTIFMYGGYAKVKIGGQKAQGKVFDDMWALHLGPVVKDQNPTWEKLSRKGQTPSPRSGATMTVYKNKALLFGGVHDEEGLHHSMKSTFYNDLFAYDMDRRRWYELELRIKSNKQRRRRKKKNQEKELAEEADDGNDSDASTDSLDQLNRFGYVDADGNIVYIDNEEEEGEGEAKVEEEEVKEEEVPVALIPMEEEEKEEEKEEPVVKPIGRINPAMLVRGHTLYIYGGVFEENDREITLDDCWSLDLKRLESWVEVLPGTMSEQVWKGDVSDTDDGSDDESGDDEDDYSDSDDEPVVKEKATPSRTFKQEIQQLQDQLELADPNRTPISTENLRDFFARTSAYWTEEAMKQDDAAARSTKELKRCGFALAEIRYNELLPVLERINLLEEQQFQAEAEAS